MNTYRFFIRNVIINKRINADYIHVVIDGGDAKQTPFIAYGDNAPVAKAKEMKAADDMARFTDNEWSNPYFAALKTFMVMGYNSDLTYTVDDNNTVTAH
jgi:hypothetical protein